MNSQAILQPGPIIPDLLFLYQHRALYLFNNSIEDRQRLAKRCDNYIWQLVPHIPEGVMVHIREAGFGGVIRCGSLKVDHALITALVERRHPETHTFHFPVGEATVSLQDVEVLWGLQVSGNVVSGIDLFKKTEKWQQYCETWMGFIPSADSFRKGQIFLTCLFNELCQPLPSNASEETYRKRAGVYIMHDLLGGFLSPDSSSNSVYLYHLYNLENLLMCGQLSWGSAILACLYRRLCKASHHKSIQVSGPLVFVQFENIKKKILQYHMELG